MGTTSKVMGLGLRAINQLAGSAMLDRLKLRKPTEQALYAGARIGFRTAGAVTRGFRQVSGGRPQRLGTATTVGLFDLNPSDDQQMLRDAALQYAMEQFRPAAMAADSAGMAPDAVLAGAEALGLAQLGIPESLGGVGGERSVLTQVLIAEALAQGDLGMAVACLAPSAVSTALVLWGDAAQQATYLPAFAAEHAPVAALALLEPTALFEPSSLQTRARRVGSEFIIDGVKSLVPRAAQAELFVIAADCEGLGPVLLLVESSASGLTVSAEPAMGLRAAAMARVHLDGVRVPETALLGDGSATVYADCVRLGRLAWNALSVGCGQAALDYVIPYVNEREAFGEPISHRQSVAFAVANMAIELDGMRLANWRAASRAEQGLPFAREAALARRLCVDHGMRIGSDAVQLLGGHGFVKEHPVERWYRDLRAVGVMEGVLLV